ncbi:hypothetical protein [Salmonella phage SSBI34]|nr:hypothetical protein [Salmonella phage SSBI34]
MLLNKNKNKMDDLELAHLMAVREAWRSAKRGLKVCVVTVYECDWLTMLGKYHDVVYQYVEKGLIYHRVEDSINPDLQLNTNDLDNVLITMEMI